MSHYSQKKKKKEENFDQKWKKMRCHEKDEKNEKMKKNKWGVDSLKLYVMKDVGLSTFKEIL